MPEPEQFDVFIIGGGVNGCGIARDAAGRGLKVGLAEMNDLASATSSASTKLFHGGLRYLEFFEFRLVREALKERETLLRAMPHISWPMRFVLPYDPEMRFAGETPASRLISGLMPWLKGRRPAWMIRLALLLYDHMGGRKLLPKTRVLHLHSDEAGEPLHPRLTKAFEYSDGWVDDARLVVLNARDASQRGAQILTRTQVIGAAAINGGWTVTLRDTDSRVERDIRTHALVNAAGPWVENVLRDIAERSSQARVRLVRGSHIVTPKLYAHDRAYFFQGSDGRIVFAIPYEQDFTLIGTTDADHAGPDQPPECTDNEAQYLIDFVAEYLHKPVSHEDIVWRFSGVRSLYDDGAATATQATRDYVLDLSMRPSPLLSVFGGKITTYRKLAEAAVTQLLSAISKDAAPWTAGVPLPGGDFATGGAEALAKDLTDRHPFLDQRWAARLVRCYGTEAGVLLGGARTATDLGQDFGATITAKELDWAIAQEWVRCADDFLWRRSKLGLRLSKAQADEVSEYIAAAVSSKSP